jgi:hypothetical protein
VTKAPPPLTAEQIEALELARKQGGKIHRNDVGWGEEEFDASPAGRERVYSRDTVASLVSRGAMRWSLHERRKGQSYAVEAELVEVRA